MVFRFYVGTRESKGVGGRVVEVGGRGTWRGVGVRGSDPVVVEESGRWDVSGGPK